MAKPLVSIVKRFDVARSVLPSIKLDQVSGLKHRPVTSLQIGARRGRSYRNASWFRQTLPCDKLHLQLRDDLVITAEVTQTKQLSSNYQATIKHLVSARMISAMLGSRGAEFLHIRSGIIEGDNNES